MIAVVSDGYSYNCKVFVFDQQGQEVACIEGWKEGDKQIKFSHISVLCLHEGYLYIRRMYDSEGWHIAVVKLSMEGRLVNRLRSGYIDDICIHGKYMVTAQGKNGVVVYDKEDSEVEARKVYTGDDVRRVSCQADMMAVVKLVEGSDVLKGKNTRKISMFKLI